LKCTGHGLIGFESSPDPFCLFLPLNAVNSDEVRLITESVLNGFIVLMVVTAVLGPVLTEHFGRQMLREKEANESPHD